MKEKTSLFNLTTYYILCLYELGFFKKLIIIETNHSRYCLRYPCKFNLVKIAFGRIIIELVQYSEQRLIQLKFISYITYDVPSTPFPSAYNQYYNNIMIACGRADFRTWRMRNAFAMYL